MSKRRSDETEPTRPAAPEGELEPTGTFEVGNPPAPLTAEDVACRVEVLASILPGLAPSSLLSAVTGANQRLQAERLYSDGAIAQRLLVRMARIASQLGDTADSAALSALADQIPRIPLYACAAGYVEARAKTTSALPEQPR